MDKLKKSILRKSKCENMRRGYQCLHVLYKGSMFMKILNKDLLVNLFMKNNLLISKTLIKQSSPANAYKIPLQS